MKKLILISIAIVAMVGVSNAQQTVCSGNTPPGGCGYYDGAGYWVFTKCFYVDCQNDSLNCGGVGSTCSSGDRCSNGSCTCFGDENCGDGIAPNQGAKATPKHVAWMLPKNKHLQLVDTCTTSLDCASPSFPDCVNNSDSFGGGHCTNFNTDFQNCGGQGNVCQAGETCQSGSCTCFGDPNCEDVAPNLGAKVQPKHIVWEIPKNKHLQPITF